MPSTGSCGLGSLYMNLISIGRFSRLTGLSIRALRLYNAEGILEPNHIDSETGYRYYTLDQLDLAERIKLLRECEMPLEQILALLRHPKETTQRLLEHQAHIQSRLQQHRQMLEKIDKLIENTTEPFVVTYKQLEPQAALCISENMLWSEENHQNTIGRLMGEIFTLNRTLKVPIVGAPFCVFPVPWRKRQMDVYACMPIQSVVACQGRVQCIEFPSLECASTIHRGDYNHTIQTIERLLAKIADDGYEVAGDIRETFLEHPLTVPNPEQYRTEIAVPVRR